MNFSILQIIVKYCNLQRNFQVISTSVNLKSLTLDFMYPFRLDKNLLLEIIGQCKNLTQLTLHSVRVDDRINEKRARMDPLNLPNLEKINISNCCFHDDLFLAGIAHNSPLLSTIRICCKWTVHALFLPSLIWIISHSQVRTV